MQNSELTQQELEVFEAYKVLVAKMEALAETDPKKYKKTLHRVRGSIGYQVFRPHYIEYMKQRYPEKGMRFISEDNGAFFSPVAPVIY